MLIPYIKKPPGLVESPGGVNGRSVPNMTSLGLKSGPTRGTKYIKGAAVCAGTCGRMTRSKHMNAADHPNTVQRKGDGMCSRCYQPVLNERRESRTELRYPILQCTAEGCTAMTRSNTDPVELAPGTRRRVSGGQCTECYKQRHTSVPEARVQAVQTELDAFLAARRARVAKQQRRFAVAS